MTWEIKKKHRIPQPHFNPEIRLFFNLTFCFCLFNVVDFLWGGGGVGVGFF